MIQYLRNSNFRIIMIVLILIFGAYAAIKSYLFYPIIQEALENSVTTSVLISSAETIAAIYFFISFPIIHLIYGSVKRSKNISSGKLGGKKIYERRTDYIVLATRLAIFAIWVWIYYFTVNNDHLYQDDVEKLMILGVTGASIIVFDVLISIIGGIVISVNKLINSYDKESLARRQKETIETINKKKEIKSLKNQKTLNKSQLV